ncbi:LacI family DNA-binding transcriptional regulator [Herbiconiux daphne]|uniref:LacI family transcriptional regulator n=1 Tax=Herbiconiux daphne TaxID=2970914 RepID=A0ABT2H3A8_9MICO|nr:LacI family DNA-binding transcriptional regulator [Herbiconiux daphne]MCS5734407.1 LacI family transcriptional regulator [Herbiconiux daphne]
MAERRATLKDVAAASGVSPSTASFVLNRAPGQTIPLVTQERVREAAERLGYVPHPLARGLREGSSRVVLLTTAGIPDGRTSSSFVAGMDAELAAADHSLVVSRAPRDGAAVARLIEAVSPRSVIDLAELIDREDRVGGAVGGAGAGRADAGRADAAPGTDPAHGLASHSLTQLRHLADRGHTNVALAFPAESSLSTFSGARQRHLLAAAGQLGLTVESVLQIGAGREGAVEALSAGWDGRDSPPTAVAAFDDRTALQVLAGFATLGVRVPDDVAVIGFDESDYGALWTPALTTVAIDARSYGARTARIALGLEVQDWAASPSVVVQRETT